MHEAHQQSAISGRLLYVEDHPLNVLLLQQWASQFPGLTLFVEMTGQAGVAAFERLRPDAVLLDMQLPDMDGLQVLEQLRALPSYDGTPVAMLTATVLEEDKMRAFDAGASAYWGKPINFRSFESDVRVLLTRGQRRRG